MAALAAFVKTEKLGFELLSDPDGGVARKYGVLGRRGYAKRRTFLIDDQGVLRHVSEKVDVRTHGADLVELVRKLRG